MNEKEAEEFIEWRREIIDEVIGNLRAEMKKENITVAEKLALASKISEMISLARVRTKR